MITLLICIIMMATVSVTLGIDILVVFITTIIITSQSTITSGI